MAAVQFINAGIISRAPGDTPYIGLVTGDTYGNTTIDAAQHTFHISGVFSKLYIKIVTNPLTGSSTFKSIKNGSDGNQSVSIGAGLTGDFYDNTNTDTIADGDEYCGQLLVGTGSDNLLPSVQSVTFAANTNTVQYLGGFGYFRILTSGTRYFPIAGPTLDSTEAIVQLRFPTAGTLKHLYVLGGNSNAAAETVTTRINGNNGNITISIGAGLSGIFEDTSNTDTIATNDLVNFISTQSSASGFSSCSPISIAFETTTGNYLLPGAQASGGNPISSGNTRYTSIVSFEHQSTNIQEARTFRNIKISKARYYFSTNATTSTSTVDILKNGVTTGIALSIASGTTGAFTDDTNSTIALDSDQLSAKIVNGGGGNLYLSSFSLLAEPYVNGGIKSLLGFWLGGVGQESEIVNPNITPSPVNVTWSTVTPIVSAGGVNITPNAVSATWNTATPTVTNVNNLTPNAVTATWSTVTPTVSAGGVNLTPSSVNATWTVVAPSVSAGSLNITPSSVSVTWTTVTPTVNVGGVNLTPNAVTATWSTATPTVSAGKVNLTPNSVSATWTVVAPTISVGGINLSPNSLTATWSTVTPSVTGEAGTINPSPVNVTWSTVTPTISAGNVNITPSSVTATWSTSAPSVTSRFNVTPSSVNATWSTVAPTITSRFNVTPSSVTATWSTVTPSVTSKKNITPSSVTATWSTVTPTVTLAISNVTPNPVTATWTIVTPSVTSSTISGTITINVTVTVLPTLSVNVTVLPTLEANVTVQVIRTLNVQVTVLPTLEVDLTVLPNIAISV